LEYIFELNDALPTNKDKSLIDDVSCGQRGFKRNLDGLLANLIIQDQN